MRTEKSQLHISPEKSVLKENDVHIWSYSLDIEDHRLQMLNRILAEDEKMKAQRFYFKKDRLAYIAGRGILRVILASYLDCKATAIQFQYNSHGKPSINHSLQFNLSHSKNMAILGVTRDREIGIDLEFIRSDFEEMRLANHFFSPREVNMLKSVRDSLRPKAFFNCWTRKEAYIKGKGMGLSIPLDSFDVSLIPGEPAKLLSVKENPKDVENWSFFDLNIFESYAAALAVEGKNVNIHFIN